MSEVAAEGDEEALRELSRIPDPPAIDPRWSWIWRAWLDLSPDRSFIAGGMGPPIPRAIARPAIEDYADRIGADVGERETLHDVLGKLDGMKLKHDAEMAKRAAERANP